MPTRRSLVQAAAWLGAAAVGQAAAAGVARPYEGPHETPKGLTLLSIKQPDGRETLGVKTDAGVLDVVAANAALAMNAPTTLEQLLVEGDAAGLARLVAAAPAARGAWRDEAAIAFGRLFANPGKIVCVGLNYRAHVAEAGEKLPTVPILFNKYNNALAAHQSTIKLPPPSVSHKFDYETELLIVIGKPTRNVSEAEALDHVAGYAIGHDFSARDLQLETGGQWMVGKTLDGFAPIGPYFVSADLVGDPNNLAISTYVNGERRQDDNTRNFIFNAQKMIAYTSTLFALAPGDIIFTGTPPGVIIGMPKDKQVWLKAGDRIESRIEKLGALKFDLG